MNKGMKKGRRNKKNSKKNGEKVYFFFGCSEDDVNGWQIKCSMLKTGVDEGDF